MEQKTGCERSMQRFMGSTFVKRDGWKTCDILQSALPVALSHKVKGIWSGVDGPYFS